MKRVSLVCIASKTIAVYEGAKQNYPDNIERMIAMAKAESAQVSRLKNAVAFAAMKWSNSFNYWNEFVAAAEMGGRAILSFKPSESTLPRDIFVDKCCVWQPGS